LRERPDDAFVETARSAIVDFFYARIAAKLGNRKPSCQRLVLPPDPLMVNQ
jgi:hypothetical protein